MSSVISWYEFDEALMTLVYLSFRLLIVTTLVSTIFLLPKASVVSGVSQSSSMQPVNRQQAKATSIYLIFFIAVE